LPILGPLYRGWCLGAPNFLATFNGRRIKPFFLPPKGNPPLDFPFYAYARSDASRSSYYASKRGGCVFLLVKPPLRVPLSTLYSFFRRSRRYTPPFRQVLTVSGIACFFLPWWPFFPTSRLSFFARENADCPFVRRSPPFSKRILRFSPFFPPRFSSPDFPAGLFSQKYGVLPPFPLCKIPTRSAAFFFFLSGDYFFSFFFCCRGITCTPPFPCPRRSFFPSFFIIFRFMRRFPFPPRSIVLLPFRPVFLLQ